MIVVVSVVGRVVDIVGVVEKIAVAAAQVLLIVM